jgi:hypothetical protein
MSRFARCSGFYQHRSPGTSRRRASNHPAGAAASTVIRHLKENTMKPRFTHGLIAAALALGAAASGATDSHDAHPGASTQKHDQAATARLVRIARQASRRFQDVSQAIAEGYVEQFGCVSGSHEGVMGVHYVNGALVGDGVLDPAKPELLVYEPLPNGRMRLVAVDYLVLSESWHAHDPSPPELLGQLFHLFESPNRFGLPEFYTLHVWAWKENPQGMFANWNPRVSCDHFTAAQD